MRQRRPVRRRIATGLGGGRTSPLNRRPARASGRRSSTAHRCPRASPPSRPNPPFRDEPLAGGRREHAEPLLRGGRGESPIDGDEGEGLRPPLGPHDRRRELQGVRRPEGVEVEQALRSVPHGKEGVHFGEGLPHAPEVLPEQLPLLPADRARPRPSRETGPHLHRREEPHHPPGILLEQSGQVPPALLEAENSEEGGGVPESHRASSSLSSRIASPSRAPGAIGPRRRSFSRKPGGRTPVPRRISPFRSSRSSHSSSPFDPPLARDAIGRISAIGVSRSSTITVPPALT